MTWDEIDLEAQAWTIPAGRAKNGRRHIAHLTDLALHTLPERRDGVSLVFSTPSGTRFQEFANAKRQLDRASSTSDWVLHDLPRTNVSGMAGLGVAPHVSDKILNHQSGSISGVAAVYQRHEFMAERKAALELWTMHVKSIANKEQTARN